MTPRITSITLGVADLGRAVAFYRDGLGWPTNVQPGAPIAFFSTQGTRLVLYPRERLADYLGVPEPADNGCPAAYLTHYVATEDEVSSALEKAVQAGATLLRPAARAFWGGVYGTFADLDGHVWEVSWAPDLQLNEWGELQLP